MLGETKQCPVCKCSFRVEETNQILCNSCKVKYPDGLKKEKEIPINLPRISEEEIRKIANEEIDKRFSAEITNDTEPIVETNDLSDKDITPETPPQDEEEKVGEGKEPSVRKVPCKKCGEDFEAKSPNSKYCDKCKEIK